MVWPRRKISIIVRRLIPRETLFNGITPIYQKSQLAGRQALVLNMQLIKIGPLKQNIYTRRLDQLPQIQRIFLIFLAQHQAQYQVMAKTHQLVFIKLERG